VGGTLHIYDSGTTRGQVGTCAVGDILEIKVALGVMHYEHNGTLKYTSTVLPTYTLTPLTPIPTQCPACRPGPTLTLTPATP
jgi:hypothetical protein